MTAANRRLDILVADDSPIVLATLSRMLTALGHVAVAVEDGQAAVDQAVGRHFDVLLIDVEMPRKDGISACHEILTSQPGTAIILITGSDEAFEHALIAGAKTVLHKPVSVQALREAIDLALGPHPTESTIENSPP